MIKRFFFCLLISFLFIYPVQASDIPSGVTPQKGTATTIVDFEDGKVIYSVSFWNVGKLGGGDYGKATITIGCKEAPAGGKCVTPTTIDGEFSGGPNGTLGEGEKAVPLVNGAYFYMSSGMGNNIQIPVENPKIFDGWKNSTALNSEDSGAGFSDLAGQVEINIPNPDGTYDEENWTSAKLKQGQTFPVGTHIKTFEKSTAIISFADASIFTLKPETEIILSSPSVRDSNVKLLYGNMMANIKKMLKDGSMQVEMSQAVAGIKGTIFVVSEDKKSSTLQVIEGSVAFNSKNTTDTAQVNTGESVTGTKIGLSAKTNFDVSSETKSWQELIDSTKKKTDTEKANQNISDISKPNSQMSYIIGGVIGLIILLGLGFLLLKKKKTD
jgi:LPXTG-motif cell wall-anchored protein